MTATDLRADATLNEDSGHVRQQVVQVIREAMDEAGSADPTVVAAAALGKFTDFQMREALAMCLPQYVRHQMSRYGWNQRTQARKPMSTADRVRSWYAQQLGVSLFIGDSWKFLRDCSAEDLHTAAADRYQKATQVHAEGDRWTKVALFMEENDRSTVAAIREDELKTLMEAS
jgi:hypothetical protein